MRSRKLCAPDMTERRDENSCAGSELGGRCGDGDPALELIRSSHPNDEVSILARPAVADLFSGQSFADKNPGI